MFTSVPKFRNIFSSTLILLNPTCLHLYCGASSGFVPRPAGQPSPSRCGPGQDSGLRMWISLWQLYPFPQMFSLPMAALHQRRTSKVTQMSGQPQLADLGRVCVLAQADGQPHWTRPGHWSTITQPLLGDAPLPLDQHAG